MNEALLLNRQIHEICYETVTLVARKTKAPAIVKNVVTFFHKHILGAKNVYPAIFVAHKLEVLVERWDDADIQRKLLVEIYVFLAVCNRPTPQDSQQPKTTSVPAAEAEPTLVKEMSGRRNEALVLKCVAALVKKHEDTLWQIVESNSSGKLNRYVQAMRFMHNALPNKKEFISEAFKVVCNNKAAFHFNTGDYSPIIFQCMLKVNYIYEAQNMHDKRMDIYLACINCPMDLLRVDPKRAAERARLLEMTREDDDEYDNNGVNVVMTRAIDLSAR